MFHITFIVYAALQCHLFHQEVDKKQGNIRDPINKAIDDQEKSCEEPSHLMWVQPN